MSNKKYKNQNVEPTKHDGLEVEMEHQVEEPETQETPEIPEPIETIGMVVNCVTLNVRKGPSKETEPIAVIDVGTELAIDPDRSVEGWVGVRTADGAIGYCVEEFIEMR